MPWGTLIEQVRRDRIIVAVAAWAYEKNYKPTMSDGDYDQLCERVHSQRNVATGNHRLDRFFQRSFDPDTGLWVHRHPDQAGLENIYARYYYPALYKDAIKRARRRARRKAR
jgi:hypothetical protein